MVVMQSISGVGEDHSKQTHLCIISDERIGLVSRGSKALQLVLDLSVHEFEQLSCGAKGVLMQTSVPLILDPINHCLPC